MMNSSILYLASQSPRRKSLLRKMKVPFRVIRSAYHEEKHSSLTPRKLVLKHASGKAHQARAPKAARWILGADTTVACGRKIFGKPATRRQAEGMLAQLAGRSHDVYTGLVLFDRVRKRTIRRVVKTRVWMKELSLAEIRRYHRRVTPLDKAGAYAIQAGPKIVQKIKGSYTNVVGLPVEELRQLLKTMK